MIPEIEFKKMIDKTLFESAERDRENQQYFREARDILVREGLIHRFSARTDVSDMYYGVIDGANLLETNQAMEDVFLSAATVADGYFTKETPRAEKPYILSANAYPHSKANDRCNSAIMMLSEIGVCGSLPHYDIRSMDGAYSTALITLFRTLKDLSYEQVEPVIDFILGDDSEEIFKGITELFNPPTEEGKYIIGLSKSDSTDDFLDENGDLFNPRIRELGLGDHNFASNVLEPGEMFTPFTKKMGTMLKTTVNGVASYIEDSDGTDEYKDLVHSLYDIGMESTLDNRLYTTYFAPLENGRAGKVFRIDYSLPKPLTAQDEDELLEHADKTIQVVNRDIVSVDYREPYAQAIVDKECKDLVSKCFSSSRESLRLKLGNSKLGYSATENYRT